MPSVSELRAALTKIQNSKTDEEKSAAQCRAQTLGAHAALGIPDPEARKQFAALYQDDIKNAMNG